MVTKSGLSKPAELGGFIQGSPRLKRRQTSRKPPLTIKQILAWADAHHERTGRWPTLRSGRITDAPDETWAAVNCALKKGRRGLSINSSLAWLLIRRRGVKKYMRRTASDHRPDPHLGRRTSSRTGQWPNQLSGPIAGSRGDTWCAVYYALTEGLRGLQGGSSLSRLLARERGLRNRCDLPPLSVDQILAWADAHHQRTGKWPTTRSGPIVGGYQGDTWSAIDQALRDGRRQLQGGSSLAQLLVHGRGAKATLFATPQCGQDPFLGRRASSVDGQVAAEAQWTHSCRPGGRRGTQSTLPCGMARAGFRKVRRWPGCWNGTAAYRPHATGRP